MSLRFHQAQGAMGQHTLARPASSARKQDWSNYAQSIFSFLDANPAYWDSLNLDVGTVETVRVSMDMDMSADGSLNQIANGTSSLPNLNQAAHGSNSSEVTTSTSSPSSVQAVQPSSFSSSSSSSQSQSAQQHPTQRIEYINGVECINIIQYPNGIPPNLLYELQQVSQYKGYPSKLRHEQVRIKQEKITKATQVIQVDTPQNPFECYIVNALRQMGFQDMHEIMTGLRHAQGANQMMAADCMAEMIMMYIVEQREEKEEAKKMDEARMHSENSIILQEGERGGDLMSTVYTTDELLGFIGGQSKAFPDSQLLCSTKVKMLFRSLLQTEDFAPGVIRKLLTLENKANKWYNKVPVPFFKHILREKVEGWYDDTMGQTSELSHDQKLDLIEKLKNEIGVIENAMYNLSEQAEGLLTPKLFISARATAVSRGLVEDEVVIMVD